VLVNNLNVLGLATCPYKAYTPLVVNANAVLPRSISTQSLQPIGWWNPQKAQRGRRMHLLQLAQCHGLPIGKPRDPGSTEKRLSVFAAEALNPVYIVTDSVISVKRY
jgi:hypothetical protein